MAFRFTVLASGSGGNASLIQTEEFGLLLDAGLGPRQLATRLASVGAAWPGIHALLLTHTHSDHWNDRTFTYLHRLRIPIYLHADHHDALRGYCSAYAALESAGLLRPYVNGGEFELGPGLRCRPVAVRHDGGPTFGFRFEGPPDLFGQPSSLGYAADLGCWDGDLVRAFTDVSVLALEFNHDVDMEYASGRQPRLIARVLGDEGHLSNAQAAALLQELLALSTPGRLRHVVQLHLSRHCNHPGLAQEAAAAVLANRVDAVAIHTASQHAPSATLHVGSAVNESSPSQPRTRPPRAAKQSSAKGCVQPWLPGLQD